MKKIADPTISQVLVMFLLEQGKRLKHPTMRKYIQVIILLRNSLNNHAYLHLDKEENEFFDKLYGRGLEFCDIFGPEKILPEIDKFLGYFMVRKVMAGKGLLRASGTVTKKLAKWLGSFQTIIGIIAIILAIWLWLDGGSAMIQIAMAIIAGLKLIVGILPAIPAMGKHLEKLAKWLGSFDTIIGIIAIIVGIWGLVS